jgi:hypothetical protein
MYLLLKCNESTANPVCRDAWSMLQERQHAKMFARGDLAGEPATLWRPCTRCAVLVRATVQGAVATPGQTQTTRIYGFQTTGTAGNYECEADDRANFTKGRF